MANGLQTQISTRNTRDLGVRPPAGPCGFEDGASPSAETLKGEAERPAPGWGGIAPRVCVLPGTSSGIYCSNPRLPSPAGGRRAGPEGPGGSEGDPDPSRPSACSARAHPRCPGSPPAGRSSLRMSRRCCVASSMSMLAQEAMGPAADTLSAPRSFR